MPADAHSGGEVKIAPLVVALLACAWQTHRTIPVWQSDVTLWAHAAALAPLKPRPVVNYGMALIADRQIGRGLSTMLRGVDLASQPHVPTWDRQETHRIFEANVAAMLP